MSDFIHRLPKAELHLHLEGSVEPATLAELSRRHTTPLPFSGNKYEQPSEGLPVLSEDEVRALYQYKDFLGFLMAFKAVTERLRTADDYELITYRMMERLRAQNVLHAEVYVSVGVVHWRGQEFSEVFRGIETGRVRGEKDFGVSLLWIFDAVRHFGPDAAQRVVEEAVKCREQSASVIGFGIGGDERRGPPELFREVYRSGCCAAANKHPLKTYFDVGVMVTLNTDDPAMFETSLEQEYGLAQKEFGFSDEQLREIARNSFEASFLPAEKKLQFLDMVDAIS